MKYYQNKKPNIYSAYYRKWREFRELKDKYSNEKFLYDILSRKFCAEKIIDGKPHSYVNFPRNISELNLILRLTTLRSAMATAYFYYSDMKHLGINSVTKRYIAELREKAKKKKSGD